MPRNKLPLAELHTHLGAAVDPPILWEMAHRHGIRLPSKDYWDFEEMITMKGSEKNTSLDEMHNHFFFWTEKIQSSPDSIEQSVKSVIGGGYRKCNLVIQELRYNPMFRNRGGEKDLDHIIMASLSGLDRTMLEYPKVKAGLILMMDRTLKFRLNSIIVDKAIKYKNRGIVGIDLGGPQRRSFSMKQHKPLFEKARKAGLGITIHTGEEGKLSELQYVVDKIKPDRIGHGHLCVKDIKLTKKIAQQKITLETCPTSSLKNSVIKDIKELKSIIDIYLKYKVRFTINTDGPEMYSTNICQEQDLLLANGILNKKQIVQCNKWATQASFIK